MTIRENFKRLLRDEQGASSLILAGSLLGMVVSSAFAVDLGALYLAKRKLQGLADSAALSLDQDDYTHGADGTVRQLVVKDGSQRVTVQNLVPGHYQGDTSVDPAQRFQPSSDPEAINAIRVELKQDVPMFFGKMITGNSSGTVHASAIATRADLAAFSLSTQLTNAANLSAGSLLSGLAETSLGLSADQVAALSADRIDILSVGDALSARFGLEGQTYRQIFNRTYSVGDVIEAYAAATTDRDSADALAQVASRVGSGEFQLSALIDLGQMGQSDYHDPSNPLGIDAYTLLRAALQLGQGETYRAQFDVAAAGLANANLIVTGRNATVHSPMMTVAAARGVVLRTSATRVYLSSQINSAVGSLQVPFYAELAPGEARLTGIECSGGPHDGVTLGVTASLGSANIGTVDASRLEDFSAPLAVSQAQLLRTALMTINADAQVAMSNGSERNLRFSLEEIAAHTWKSVAATDLVGSIAGSLANDVEVRVQALGLGVNAGAASAAVGTALSGVAPSIDAVLEAALRSAGVQLGVSNATVDRVSCGVPLLVG